MRKRLKIQLELPLDLVYHILLRLPVKTLSRLRCVSKAWCEIIFDPHFQKEHSRLSQQRPLLLVSNIDRPFLQLTTYTNQGPLLREFTSHEVSNVFMPASFTIIQSCQGLLCFVDNLERWFVRNPESSILLCNLSTEETLMLPERPDHEFQICVGFAFAASSKVFKVFRFFNHDGDDEGECYCQVFTLGATDGWREATSPPYMPIFEGHLPLLHGALHLLPSEEEFLGFEDDKYIAAIDVDTEEYKRIPLPDIYFQPGRSPHSSEHLGLVELRGSLCLTFDFFETKKMLELWFLEDYKCGRWVKQYNIDLISTDSFIWAFPLAITGDGCIWLNVLYDHQKGSELCLYDTERKCFVETGVKGTNCKAIVYVESFSTLGGSHNMFF